MEVYHYTSLAGLKAIQNAGFIEQSSLERTDAAFGEGVYLTTISPEVGRKKIAENNYGPYLATHMEDLGRVECCIQLWIPKEKLVRAKSDRDVWIHKGRVILKDYKYETVRWDIQDRTCAVL